MGPASRRCFIGKTQWKITMPVSLLFAPFSPFFAGGMVVVEAMSSALPLQQSHGRKHWRSSTTWQGKDERSMTGWWFQIFLIFTPIWRNDPIWLIFFKWVETTNQMIFCLFFLWCFSFYLYHGKSPLNLNKPPFGEYIFYFFQPPQANLVTEIIETLEKCQISNRVFLNDDVKLQCRYHGNSRGQPPRLGLYWSMWRGRLGTMVSWCWVDGGCRGCSNVGVVRGVRGVLEVGGFGGRRRSLAWALRTRNRPTLASEEVASLRLPCDLTVRKTERPTAESAILCVWNQSASDFFVWIKCPNC